MKQKLLSLVVLGLFSSITSAADTAATSADSNPALTKQIEETLKKIQADNGVEFYGYARAGLFSRPTDKNGDVEFDKYSLSGDSRLQFFRLGNESDQYLAFGMKKKFTFDNGVKASINFKPEMWHGPSGSGSNIKTAYFYGDVSGLSFAPNVSFWAGQRGHVLNDIHILDRDMITDDGAIGAGADGIKVGSAKLNVGVFSANSLLDNDMGANVSANRFNFQLHDISVNNGGKLTVTGGKVFGGGLKGEKGYSVGLIHNQSQFITPGLSNTLYLQRSTGHLHFTGKWANGLTSTQLPAATNSFADTLNWQKGKFGGLALIGYQTTKEDGSNTAKYGSIGGRLSYGIAPNVKLLTELSYTDRKQSGAATQKLSKATVGVALSPNTDFWTRPELRLYYSRIHRNDAAIAASSNADGKNNVNLFGIQIETWW